MVSRYKYDGYRLRIERDGGRVRLVTRGGDDWTSRFPWIAEAALKNRHTHFVIDGQAVILGIDGRSDFNALHSGKHGAEVQLCAFDVLAIGSEDLRVLPLSTRKTYLDRLLRGRPEGIFGSPFEIGQIGPQLFRTACRMDLEGLVSKRGDRPYRGGRSKDWIKIKNRTHNAFDRLSLRAITAALRPEAIISRSWLSSDAVQARPAGITMLAHAVFYEATEQDRLGSRPEKPAA